MKALALAPLVLLLAKQAPAHGSEGSLHERIVEVELATSDAGSETWIEHMPESDGTLSAWVLERPGLSLRVEGPTGAPLARKDGKGGAGAGAAFARVEVVRGEPVRLGLVTADTDVTTARLHVVLSPEDDATRRAAATARALADEVRIATDAGRRAEARTRLAAGLDEVLAVPGAAQSELVLGAVWQLGFAASGLGDEASARRVWNVVREHRERTLPPDHDLLQDARFNVAGAAYQARELRLARETLELVVAAYRRSSPGGSPDLLAAEGLLGAILFELGDLSASCAVQERVLAGLEAAERPDRRGLALARSNLGVALRAVGDFARARALLERSAAEFESILPEGDQVLTNVRANLALVMDDAGDSLGASAVLARALTDARAALPPEHADIAWLRGNLASVLARAGDLEGARELLEETLERFEGRLAATHPDLVRTRSNLATVLIRMGDAERACALLEEVLAVREETLPHDHRDVLVARTNLAGGLMALGDLESAAALWEGVLDVRERTLAPDDPDLLVARENVVTSLLVAGREDDARALVMRNAEGMLRRAAGALLLAPREAREVIAADARRTGQLLFLSGGLDREGQERVFELIEAQRMATTLPARSSGLVRREPELAALAARVAATREELSDLVTRARTPEDAASLTERVASLSGRRDADERALRRALVARGLTVEVAGASGIAAALPEGTAAIEFLRWGAGTSTPGDGRDRMLAFVVTRRAGLWSVDLGPCDAITDLVLRWRSAIGAPVEAGAPVLAQDEGAIELAMALPPRRGKTLEANGVVPGTAAADELGAELRALVLAPCLAVLDERPARLNVVPDDVLHLVPLDALPRGDGPGVVGDGLPIHVRITLQPAAARAASPAASTLVALGGVDFDASGVQTRDEPSVAPAQTPPMRSAAAAFERLPGTQAEVEALAELYELAVGDESVLLERGDASKRALAENAPRARFLHVATHGWFASDEVYSIGDDPVGHERSPVDGAVRGFAPETLCGLALAGANRDRDPQGRVPGLLTAEELATFDLSACELAVLSACETNVGVRRAGQGILSLRNALHAAGAGAAITSLWRVDDEATRSLFEAFYGALWVEGVGTAEALWRAKQVLRDRGRPVRDWAGWVLSGDAG